MLRCLFVSLLAVVFVSGCGTFGSVRVGGFYPTRQGEICTRSLGVGAGLGIFKSKGTATILPPPAPTCCVPKPSCVAPSPDPKFMQPMPVPPAEPQFGPKVELGEPAVPPGEFGQKGHVLPVPPEPEAEEAIKPTGGYYFFPRPKKTTEPKAEANKPQALQVPKSFSMPNERKPKDPVKLLPPEPVEDGKKKTQPPAQVKPLRGYYPVA